MFQRFTDRARKVMALAHQQAARFRNEYVGTEHILLGLIREGSGSGFRILKKLVEDTQSVDTRIAALIKPGAAMVPEGRLPQTPRVKMVVIRAIEEAKRLGHDSVGTEHLLLGLLRDEQTVAGKILTEFGVRLDAVRTIISSHEDPRVEQIMRWLLEFETDEKRVSNGEAFMAQLVPLGALITYTRGVLVREEELVSDGESGASALILRIASELELAAAELRKFGGEKINSLK